MRKILLLTIGLVLCCSASVEAAMTYGAAYYQKRVSYLGSGYSDSDPLYLFINEVETTMDATSGVTGVLFTPGTAPTASEGLVYYDSASSGLLLYNGTNWITIDTAGGTSLDGSYNLGSTIDVDGDAVTLTVSNTDNNRVLDLVQNDTTNNPETVRITNTGTGDTLQFVSTGTNDIDGTSSTWQASAAGTLTAVAFAVGTGDLTFSEQSEGIRNDTNGEIEFFSDTGTTEDFSIGLGANNNTVTWSSDSGAVTLDYGDFDTLQNMTAITGEAADMTISITADAGGEDLLIQQAGAVDGSLDLRSAGTGADAIKIYASAAGIDLDATGSTLTMTNAADGSADDFTIEVTGAFDSSLILQSTGTGGDAISLTTSAATGDIVINSGDMINIDAADDILIDIAGAAGEDFILTNTGGSINLSASEAVDDALNFDATAGGLDVDAVLSIVLTSTENTADSIVLQSTLGGIDILCDAASAGEDIDIANTGGSVNISSSEAADLAVNISTSDAAGQIQITSADTTVDGLEIDSSGGIDIDAADDIDLTLAAGTAGEDILLTVTGAINSSITLTSSGTSNDAIALITSAGGMDFTVAGAAAGEDMDLDADSSINIKSSEASVDDAIVIETTGAGSGMQITSLADIDITTTGAAGEDILITNTGGSIAVTATENIQNALHLETNGGTSESINIYANQGTGASATTEHDASIQLHSDAGGISLYTTGSVADAIRLETNGGTAETIVINNVQGTGADAITIAANAAGGDLNLDSVLGRIEIEAEENVAEAVLITADGGTSTTLKIHNDTGTSVTEGAGAIEILADAGSVELKSTANLAKSIQIIADAGTTESIYVQSDQGTAAAAATESDAAIQLVADVGGVGIRSGLNAANAIRLEADGGANEIVILHSNQGTGAAAATESDASIQLLSDVGGIGLRTSLNAADAIRLETDGGTSEQIILHSNQGTSVTEGTAAIQLLADAGGIVLESNANLANAITLVTDAGTTETITIHSDLGSSVSETAASIQVTSDDGGISLLSTSNLAKAIQIVADGGTTETIYIQADQGNTATSINVVSDAGGITLNANSGVVFTQGQTRKQFFTPKDVELDGTNPASLTDIGTDGQANVSTLTFDADGGVTGDDVVYFMWRVPDGYVVDSARLNVAYSFSAAEDAADEAQFDFTVNAIAQNEVIDAAGTALADQTTVIADASADNGKIHTSQYNIEVEDIAVDDYVIIEVAVDESASALTASGTLDVHYFEIEWESTE